MATFSQIVTLAARITPVIGPCPATAIYQVPGGKIARITKADNLGSSLLYGVLVFSNTAPSGTTSNSGLAPGARFRNLNDTWLAAGDKIVVYDNFDRHNTTAASSHPNGYFVSVEEYDI